MTGILASTVANFAGKSAAKVLSPSHFMPSQIGKTRESSGQSTEEAIHIIHMIHKQQNAGAKVNG